MASGKLSGGIIDTAGKLAALGISPLDFLRTTDSVERALLIEVYNKTLDNKELLDDNLASKIASKLAKAMSGK